MIKNILLLVVCTSSVMLIGAERRRVKPKRMHVAAAGSAQARVLENAEEERRARGCWDKFMKYAIPASLAFFLVCASSALYLQNSMGECIRPSETMTGQCWSLLGYSRQGYHTSDVHLPYDGNYEAGAVYDGPEVEEFLKKRPDIFHVCVQRAPCPDKKKKKDGN